MPSAETIFALFISILMGRIAYNSLYRYMKMPTNYEFTFYWGIAFSLFSLLILFHGIDIYSINYISPHSISLGIISIIIPWLILFSILFIISDNYTAMVRKKIRTFMYFLLLFILFSQAMAASWQSNAAYLFLLHLQSLILYCVCFYLLYKRIKSSRYIQLSLIFFSLFHLVYLVELFINGDPSVYSLIRKSFITLGTVIIALEVNSQLNRGVYSKPMLIFKQIIEFIKEHFFKIAAAVASLLFFLSRNNDNFLRKKAKEKEKEHKERRELIKEEKKILDEKIENYYNNEAMEEILKKEKEIDKIREEVDDENIKQEDIEKRISELKELREELAEKREEEKGNEKFSENEADEAYDYIDDILDDSSADNS